MTRILALITCISWMVAAFASETASSFESYHYVSAKYWGEVKDINVVREIGGGTVIIPEFDSSCPEYIKGPFVYACNIMGEFLPPSLPLKVKVYCNTLSGSQRTAISKVTMKGYNDVGHPVFSEYTSLMPRIKGVTLQEFFQECSASYLMYIQESAFFTATPDIEIVYNEEMLDEMSFSLSTTPGQEYDFVSVALRDLLIGMGFTSHFRYDYEAKVLDKPRQNMTPFEMFIEQALGNPSDGTARLDAATKGELNVQGYKLYAPTTWVNGVSLNHFMGSGDALSDLLSYNFGRGTVIRSLSGSSVHMCRYLLGWELNIPTGSTGSSISGSGTTSIKVPYNGSIVLDTSKMVETSHSSLNSTTAMKTALSAQSDEQTAFEYVSQFHPYQTPNGNTNCEGFSITILKKDGTWDLVYFKYPEEGSYIVDMNTWEFHYDNDEYERTADGYLRACITISERKNNPTKLCYSQRSKYCVVDYLPQKIKLSHSFPNTTAALTTENKTNASNSIIRIYFGNLEGITRIVLERKRQGAVIADKSQINDFKRGYVDVTIDRSKTFTFTAVGYNANGYTRSLPLTIPALSTASATSSLSYAIENGIIKFNTDDDRTLELEYSIAPIDANTLTGVISGKTDNEIDLTGLPHGNYAIKVTEISTGIIKSYKIRK